MDLAKIAELLGSKTEGDPAMQESEEAQFYTHMLRIDDVDNRAAATVADVPAEEEPASASDSPDQILESAESLTRENDDTVPEPAETTSAIVAPDAEPSQALFSEEDISVEPAEMFVDNSTADASAASPDQQDGADPEPASVFSETGDDAIPAELLSGSEIPIEPNGSIEDSGEDAVPVALQHDSGNDAEPSEVFIESGEQAEPTAQTQQATANAEPIGVFSDPGEDALPAELVGDSDIPTEPNSAVAESGADAVPAELQHEVGDDAEPADILVEHGDQAEPARQDTESAPDAEPPDMLVESGEQAEAAIQDPQSSPDAQPAELFVERSTEDAAPAMAETVSGEDAVPAHFQADEIPDAVVSENLSAHGSMTTIVPESLMEAGFQDVMRVFDTSVRMPEIQIGEIPSSELPDDDEEILSSTEGAERAMSALTGSLMSLERKI